VASGAKIDGSEPSACDMLPHGGHRTAKSISDFLHGQNVLHLSLLGKNLAGLPKEMH
jgi:hypothetical protein